MIPNLENARPGRALLLFALLAACGGRPPIDPEPDASAEIDAGPPPASCDNGVLDGEESSVDCGGTECDPCDHGLRCVRHEDCLGGVCSRDYCLMPTCGDGAQNGDETGVDCGGQCGLCPAGQPCTSNAECESHRCMSGGVCAESTCFDGITNGAESDFDCGGDMCSACDTDRACASAEDCASSRCIEGRCAEATCSDRVRNQDETAIDCGGIACTPCRDGFACLVASDCMSRRCVDARCEP